ncbi:hypothetical protein COT50_02560 [candidate division WWE3 bacterium CG08_land_8_20_14_0_20_41_10]|uniref:Type 4 fimbrial biogenesis protein PilX N-terminal domain-containing protein n=1 Tax=candidate division WWE3 bacterium CG08_land_8_20_14_0_20_41_10 TaxID=1975085 RepID=A0A2H0XBN9_UNCKA|nr:MAG: hypothetical protein COT50_02560 [candidate division WWE3 bacterium CG08_land_8_20_14_0_20_41_10]
MRKDSGQILTSVLVFMAFGLSVIALSATLTVINIQNTAKLAQSEQASNYAEAGAEEAILRLIRDPAYSGGSLPLSADTVIGITVTGVGDSRTIISTATYNGFTKKVQAVVSLANNKATLVSWKQII